VYLDCAGTDVRLLACSPGTPVVELLGPYDDIPIGGWWHAVRIDLDERSIWRGPSCSCPRPRAIAFVEHLLVDRPGDLLRRYEPL
jgi:hypothetical protein